MPTLHWIGKEKVINHHLDVPYRVLEHQYTFSSQKADALEVPSSINLKAEALEAETTGNKIIHGDNLEALKALLPEYEGKIKCIYIDPPYNTGNEGWVYNDNVNDPKIKKWLGQVVGKEAEDLTRHDKWLCMMYPRLKLLHKLLAEDGAIFISIDDNEQANLKLLCDEIFGERNFIANLIWRKKAGGANDSLSIAVEHEYVIAYRKNINPIKKIPLGNDTLKNYRFKDEKFESHSYYLIKDLNDSSLQDSSGLHYDIECPDKTVLKGENNQWKCSKETYLTRLSQNRIEFKRDKKNNWKVYYKIYLNEEKGVLRTDSDGKTIQKGRNASSLLYDVALNKTANDEIKLIFNKSKPFDYPKPSKLIEYLLQICTDKNSIILDSNAGSGTTAHAVLNLNKQDGGNRKFICIEMEDYAETITAERVKRVINGYGSTGSPQAEGTGGSFDYYELGPALFNEDNEINELVGVEKLRQYMYYTETKSVFKAPSPSERAGGEAYLLNKHNDTAYYFYYEQDGVTTLNHDFLSTIKTRAEQYVIYADNCLLTKEFMTKHHIIFKKIPRDITKF